MGLAGLVLAGVAVALVARPEVPTPEAPEAGAGPRERAASAPAIDGTGGFDGINAAEAFAGETPANASSSRPGEAGPAGAIPAPAAEDGDAPRRPPIEGTERAVLARFLEIAATDRDAFDRALAETLAGDGPTHERVAALRAVWSVESVDALPRFRATLARDAEGEPTGVVAAFAVDFLGRMAKDEPRAREFLANEVLANDHRSDLRVRAARSLGRTVDGIDRDRFEAGLRTERDRVVIEAAILGIRDGRSAEEAEAAAIELTRSHTDPEVRAWLTSWWKAAVADSAGR